jgi:hypothetical protein
VSIKESSRTGWSRRGLLRGGVALGAFMAFPGCASAQGRRIGPNDRINVASIGAGGMGATNMSALTAENIVAYADPDLGRVDRSLRDGDGVLRPERVELKAAYDKAEQFADYRKMFDSGRISRRC